MSRVCQCCGKRPSVGNRVSRRGLAKHKGGVGRKITGVTRRQFRPNLQRVRVQITGGGVERTWVCTQCLRSGKVSKPKRAPAVHPAPERVPEPVEVAVEASEDELDAEDEATDRDADLDGTPESES